MAVSKKSLLDRLRDGVVVGDGGFVFALEKRGYVKAGPWTPECVVENPEAVLQLHREFVRAGADVAQAFSFYASEDKLDNRGNLAGSNHSVDKINKEAAALAIKAASEVEGELAPLTVGGISRAHPTLMVMARRRSRRSSKNNSANSRTSTSSYVNTLNI